eukprot:CAMPEP_0194134416 /NCGR_PEP_ID=MMETSP0152-20130528/4503_1 /TAXON_ID=1049557 /ORGANISM="Thalassiothrix antarctica, Strain L6-D1" /LENGTH=653 /DNA_ID=CAMNT_0038830143 /DNA_START=334 /DNA_END=2295 /DNA_ORIENTATION=-
MSSSNSDFDNKEMNNSNNVLVVVSPPGGVGEVAAVEAARLGSRVKWFVVSSSINSASISVKLSSMTLSEISKRGGSVQIAGAQDADLVKLSGDESRDAVRAWCDSSTSSNAATALSSSLVCCLDGVDDIEIEEDPDDMGDKNAKAKKKKDAIETWKQGVMVAAREASQSDIISNNSRRIAIVSATAERENNGDDSNEENNLFSVLELAERLPKIRINGNVDKNTKTKAMKDGPISMLDDVGVNLRKTFGIEEKVKRIDDIPLTLTKAIRADTKLRHGSLFGLPESSPNFSALVEGPRKNPALCREYEERLVRLDATSSLLPPEASGAGSKMFLGEEAKVDFSTCRHAVGEAAALLATFALETTSFSTKSGIIDLCVSSLPGIQKFDLWQSELERAQKQQSQTDSGLVFSQDFGKIPDPNRFSNWLCQKWGPTVLTKTYDLAAIRTGARPVYLKQTSETEVEIIWQELKDDTFQSVEKGKLVISIAPKVVSVKDGNVNTKQALYGMKAMRVPPNGGRPLNGESIIVRRLADAASQAMEKGLATPPPRMKKVKKQVEKPKVVSSRVMPMPPKNPAAAAVEAAKAAAMARPPPAAGAKTTVTNGPRQAGARRSSKRSRGSGRPRQRKQPLPEINKEDVNAENDNGDRVETEEGAFE